MDRTLNNKKKGISTAGIVCIIALFVLLILLDNVFPKTAFTSMLVPVLKKGAIYSLLCVSMNLLNGFTGLFSLGQAGFMLIGAYTYAIISIPNDLRDTVYMYSNGSDVHFSIPEMLGNVLGKDAGNIVGAILCILIAGCVAALFAFLIGLPVLRLKSDYLAIASLGFAEIIRALCQWDGLARITSGSFQLRKYTNFEDMRIGSFSLSTTFTFLIAGLCIFVIILLINSTYGRAFKAIRDDEIAAEAMGINLARHKMQSFVMSSFFVGIGGALLAMYQTTIIASPFKSAMTYEILLMVVIGGIGSISGSCIAAFLYTASNEWWLRFLDSGSMNLFGNRIPVPFFRDGFRKVVFSVVIMIIVLFFSRGIMGDKELSFERIGAWFRRKFSGRSKKEAA